MAKRRRLTAPSPAPGAAAPVGTPPSGHLPGGAAPSGSGSSGQAPSGRVPSGRVPSGRVPIAEVVGGIADAAGAEEVAAELTAARAEGRLVRALPLDRVEADHLLRDRLPEAADAAGEEMAALIASIRASGQRAPIETVALDPGPDGARYGLISGWRRIAALRHLAAEGAGPGTVLAIVRPPQDAARSYLAMVEENEIRAPLSFWERARLVARAAEAGVFEDEATALRELFAAAPRARRSKIGSFVPVVSALQGALPFPAALTERSGLALAKALREDPGFGPALAARLRADPPADPGGQAEALEDALRVAAKPAAAPASPEAPGEVTVRRESGALILEGPGIAGPGFEARLRRWLGRPRD